MKTFFSRLLPVAFAVFVAAALVLSRILGISQDGFRMLTFILVSSLVLAPFWFFSKRFTEQVKTTADNRIRAALDQINYEHDLAEWKRQADDLPPGEKPANPPPCPPDWSWS
jgi:hypothetical protein